MEKKWEPVEVLRHARHDWLNQIQLIKANLSLNRVERAQAIIEDLSARSHSESKLTNLHMARVAELLLTFNWQEHFYRLEVEVSGREQDLSNHEAALFAVLTDLLERLDRCADLGAENHTMVSFQLEDDGVLITIDFNGSLKETEALAKSAFLHKGFEIIEHYAGKEAFVITINYALA